MPLISICIPAYKAERYLEAALESIAAQRFQDWELVVTEDGSRDRTEQIVRAFAQRVAQPVIYNRHDGNLGLSTARNTGAAAARGEWIAFIDSDDLWEPTHLEDLVAAGKSDDVDMVFAGTQPFDDSTGEKLPPRIPTDQDLAQLPAAVFSGRLSILPSSVMVRRSCFTRFGGFSTLYQHAMDSEYWLRVLRGGGQVAYTGNITCLYRKHPGAMSLRATRILTNTAQICFSYSDWDRIPRDLARERPAKLYRYAARSSLRTDPKHALKLVKQSLRVHPFLLRTWGFFAYSVIYFALHSISWKFLPEAEPATAKVH